MKLKNYQALFLLLQWGCHKNSQESLVLSEKSNARDVIAPTAFDCGQGTTEYMSFKKLEFAVTTPPADVTLGKFVEITHPDQRHYQKFRLDLCIAPDGTPTLIKILVSRPTFLGNPDSFTEITPGADAKITGLMEGISGEPEKMDILIPWAENTQVYGLKGARLADGSVTYFYNAELVDNTILVGNIHAGALDFFNPFSSLDGKVCGQGKHLLRKLTLPSPHGAVSLEMELCALESFGTTQEAYRKVTLIDLGAPVAYQSKEIVISNFTKSDLLPYLGWATAHHNVCTSTFIKLPYGTIGLTRMGRAGNIGGGDGPAQCAPFVDGAPNIEPTLAQSASVLEFKYQDRELVRIKDPKIQYEEIDLDTVASETGSGPIISGQ